MGQPAKAANRPSCPSSTLVMTKLPAVTDNQKDIRFPQVVAVMQVPIGTGSRFAALRDRPAAGGQCESNGTCFHSCRCAATATRAADQACTRGACRAEYCWPQPIDPRSCQQLPAIPASISMLCTRNGIGNSPSLRGATSGLGSV